MLDLCASEVLLLDDMFTGSSEGIFWTLTLAPKPSCGVPSLRRLCSGLSQLTLSASLISSENSSENFGNLWKNWKIGKKKEGENRNPEKDQRLSFGQERIKGGGNKRGELGTTRYLPFAEKMAPIPVLEQVRMRGATLCARSMRRTPPAALLRRRKSLARASSADDDAARAKAEFEEKMKDPAVLESMKTMMSR